MAVFSVEIDFHDGVSPPEVLAIRRPYAIIGTSENAHIVIEGSTAGLNEFSIGRSLGREFTCHTLNSTNKKATLLKMVDGTYFEESKLSFNEVSVYITALDNDLRVLTAEDLKDAPLRILRQSLTFQSPLFPALAVVDPLGAVMSFSKDKNIRIGRSRSCHFRLDYLDVAPEQAEIYFSGGTYKLKILDDNFVTSVDGSPVNGEVELVPNSKIKIGNSVTLSLVTSQAEFSSNYQAVEEEVKAPTKEDLKYPCLVTKDERIQPNRYVFAPGAEITIGRDPANDIWVSAAHISREHVILKALVGNKISLEDSSSNGTFRGEERLPSGAPIDISDELAIFDLKEDLEFALCFNADHEREYLGEDFHEEEVVEVEEQEVEIAIKEDVPYGGLTGAMPALSDVEEIEEESEQVAQDFFDDDFDTQGELLGPLGQTTSFIALIGLITLIVLLGIWLIGS